MSMTIKAGKMSQGGYVGPGVGGIRPLPRGMQMGDPGIFGDIWGGIKGAATGLLSGGPLGAIGGALSGSGIIKPPTPTLPPMVTPRLPVRNGFQSAPTGIRVGGLLPGGAAPYVGYDRPATNGMGPPKGYRLNKSGYWLKSGEYVQPESRYVKIRRRNPMNPRALDRAMTRITSAKRASKKLGRITVRAPSCKR